MKGFTTLIAAAITASVALAQDPGAPAKVPKGKWFDGERGYLEALELQKQTGADIFLYFFCHDNLDEKGLCSWWEKHGMQEGKVSKFLQDYIKVKVQMPLRKKEEPTFAAYKFNKTPAVFIATSAGGFPARCHVFNWPNSKPELKSHTDLIDLFTKASSPKPGR
jgi:hypothetical protein